jgi:broad specificity phosphatase PhoE
MTLTVWLIRHGESEGNAGLRTPSTRETALTPKGMMQAERLAEVFQEPPSLLVTSSYLRSQQTAAPIMRRFPGVPHEVWPVQEFTYLAALRYHFTTFRERLAPAEAFWQRNDPWHRDGEGAESFADLMGRVEETLQRLKQQADGFVAIITHGLFMRAVYWCLLTGSFEARPERMQRFYHVRAAFSVPNTAILKLVLRDDEVWMSPLSTAHLASLETREPEQPEASVSQPDE